MTLLAVTAAFKSRSQASATVDRLVENGIQRSQIRITPQDEFGASPPTTTSVPANTRTDISGASAGQSFYDAARDEKGFWASFGNLFMPDEDRHSYTEHVHRGGIIVSATVDMSIAPKVEDILDQASTVNMGDRENSWRKEGWTGGQRQRATGIPLAHARTDVTDFNTDLRNQAEQNTKCEPEKVGGTIGETSLIGQNQLNFGERLRSSRVRVRSYVIGPEISDQFS